MIVEQRESVQPSIEHLLNCRDEMMGCQQALSELQKICTTTHGSAVLMKKVRDSCVGVFNVREKKLHALDEKANDIMRLISQELMDLERSMFNDNTTDSDVETDSDSDGIYKTYDQPHSDDDDDDDDHTNNGNRSTFATGFPSSSTTAKTVPITRASFVSTIPDTPPTTMIPEREIDMLARRFVLGGRSPKGRSKVRKSLNSNQVELNRSSLLGGTLYKTNTDETNRNIIDMNRLSSTRSSTRSSARSSGRPSTNKSFSPTIYSRKSPAAEKVRKERNEQRRNSYQRKTTLETAKMRIRFGEIMTSLRSAIEIEQSDLIKELNHAAGNNLTNNKSHFGIETSMGTDSKKMKKSVSWEQFKNVISLYISKTSDIVLLFDVLDNRGERRVSIAEMSFVFNSRWVPSPRSAFLATAEHSKNKNHSIYVDAKEGSSNSTVVKDNDGMTPYSRCQFIFQRYASFNERSMSLVEWAAFVHDSRMLDNYITFDIALLIYDHVSSMDQSMDQSIDQSMDQTMDHVSSMESMDQPMKQTMEPTMDQSMEDKDNETVRITEYSWFCATHALLLCKMYKRSPMEDDYLGPEEWNEDMCTIFDDLYMRPIVRVLKWNVQRPRWQGRWLSSIHCMTEVCITHSELYKACFLVIAQVETEIKDSGNNNIVNQNKLMEKSQSSNGNNKSIPKESIDLFRSKSQIVWEWDVEVSRITVLSFFKYIGITGRIISEEKLNLILDGLHNHTSLHGKRVQHMLFPEFCEVLVAIANHMMDTITTTEDNAATINIACQIPLPMASSSLEGGITLTSKLERINTYLKGDVVLITNEYFSRTKMLTNRVRDQIYLMRRERAFTSLTHDDAYSGKVVNEYQHKMSFTR